MPSEIPGAADFQPGRGDLTMLPPLPLNITNTSQGYLGGFSLT